MAVDLHPEWPEGLFRSDILVVVESTHRYFGRSGCHAHDEGTPRAAWPRKVEVPIQTERVVQIETLREVPVAQQTVVTVDRRIEVPTGTVPLFGSGWWSCGCGRLRCKGLGGGGVYLIESTIQRHHLVLTVSEPKKLGEL